MNYKESKKILEEIKKAKKILLSCHWHPDADSVASNLAMYKILMNYKKKVKVVSPEEIDSNVKFLPNSDKIEVINNKSFDYSDYDLFIILDSSSLDRTIGLNNIDVPDVPIITIDHHITNSGYGFINLLDVTSSTCEILYRLFQDWKVEFDKDLALTLLTGIYDDTVSFQTSSTKSSTLRVSSELVNLGAEIEEIIRNSYHSNSYELLRLWGVLLEKAKIDKKHKFIWTAIKYKEYEKFGKPAEAKSSAASLFFRTVTDTDFGVVMIEQEPGILNVSFRSRTDFNVSVIAQELGGGGHERAAGAWFEFKSFDNAVEKVLMFTKKYAKKQKAN